MSDYQQKLIGFNNTPKYKREMSFLTTLVNPQKTDKILDYGCGTGTMMDDMREEDGPTVYGYDVQYYIEEPDCFWWRQELTFQFNKVYFMHSIAHIPDIEQKLIKLKEEFLLPNSQVYVLTPNASWMTAKNNPDYIPDPTVVEQFTPKSLEDLFIRCGFKIEILGQFGEELEGQHERIFLNARL